MSDIFIQILYLDLWSQVYVGTIDAIIQLNCFMKFGHFRFLQIHFSAEIDFISRRRHYICILNSRNMPITHNLKKKKNMKIQVTFKDLILCLCVYFVYPSFNDWLCFFIFGIFLRICLDTFLCLWQIIRIDNHTFFTEHIKYI